MKSWRRCSFGSAFHTAAYESLGDFMNISRTHRDEDVVRGNPPPQFVHNLRIAAIQELDLLCQLRDQLRRHTFHRLLARGVDGGHEGHVRLDEAIRELLGELACARVEVRLKKCNDSTPRIPLTSSSDGRMNLCGMMGVVIDDDSTAILPENLEATIDPQELRESGNDLFRGDAELARGADCRQGVPHVVLTRHE